MRSRKLQAVSAVTLALLLLSACGKTKPPVPETSGITSPEIGALTAAEEEKMKAKVAEYKEKNPNIAVTWFKIRCGDEEKVYCTTINLAMNHWAQSSYSDGWKLYDDEEKVLSSDGCWRLDPGEGRDIYSPIVSHRVYEAKYIGDGPGTAHRQ